MAQITPETIQKICTRNGQFYVPDRIKASIEGCLANDNEEVITEEYRRLMSKFKGYRESMRPVPIDYKNDLTLDAYTIYYLSRYMSIPSVALRDLARHPFFQDVPDSFSVLDLGSGTGAVALGLLSLFDNAPLSQVALNFTAIDCCAEALDRQKCLIDRAGFNSEQVHYYEEDLCNINSCMKLVTNESPYHLIFCANCLTELELDVATEIVGRLPQILADNGAIIIAEAQRNYIKKMIKSLAMTAESCGLHVYYPCTGSDCPSSYGLYCWVWRYHDYDFPPIKINGQPLQEKPRDELVLSWLILTHQNVSIYDTFTWQRSDLLWGPISRVKPHFSACYEDQEIAFERDYNVSPSYKRGSIVGLSSELEVKEYYEM